MQAGNLKGPINGTDVPPAPRGAIALFLDVVDLRNFYAQPLGTVARRFVSRGIRARWADTRGLRVVGVGYATPYLGLFREEAERCLAFMPAAGSYFLDAGNKLLYHGRIDNNRDMSQVESSELRDALEATLAGKPVVKTTANAFGCSIKRAE